MTADLIYYKSFEISSILKKQQKKRVLNAVVLVPGEQEKSFSYTYVAKRHRGQGSSVATGRGAETFCHLS